MDEQERRYVAIDAKSFYASVECVERRLNPLTTHLVVADESRTEKTICLAVSPSLKACGISGRARLFEVVERVREVNRERLRAGIRSGVIRRDAGTGRYAFSAESSDAEALAADPSLGLTYLIAPPRMRLYEEYSSRIYQTYLRFVAPEDILVYSIDEVFIDVTRYLKTYGMTAHELTMTMIREVLKATGITATAGIGTNLYLAKVAMDIVAKKAPPDKDGVRIAELDELSYRRQLWTHRPLKDFWRVGGGSTARLEAMRLFTMGDIARASLVPAREEQLYKAFGVNAELLIDHAWGWEPVTIEDVRRYKPATNSLSSGQVLGTPYPFEKARLIVREMTELMVLDLVRKRLVTKQLVLDLHYDRESLAGFRGDVEQDYYGRTVPKHAHGSENIDHYTSSSRTITEAMMRLFDRIANPGLLVRRVGIAAAGLISEEDVPQDTPVQLDLFTDFEAEEQARNAAMAQERNERKLQQAALAIQDKFGKNALLKGMNLLEGGTTIDRNRQIGGHRAGDDG